MRNPFVTRKREEELRAEGFAAAVAASHTVRTPNTYHFVPNLQQNGGTVVGTLQVGPKVDRAPTGVALYEKGHFERPGSWATSHRKINWSQYCPLAIYHQPFTHARQITWYPTRWRYLRDQITLYAQNPRLAYQKLTKGVREVRHER